jgi:hypothetical protein
VVGFFEYGQALSLLSRFLLLLSPEELKVAEQIVSERDEFVVYTNLSRRIEARPGPLSERSNFAQDKFDRRGIAWLLGLARVELAAMVAGFSPDSDAFAKDRPSSYELAAYRELVEDAMRAHYWSLARDSAPRTMRRGMTPDQQAIAYLRRTTLAIKFLREVRNERQGQLTSLQQAELDTWEQQLRDLQSFLMYDVLGVHDAVAATNSSNSLYLHKCGTTREQILEDIRSGKAKVNGASTAAMAQLQKELGSTVPESAKPNQSDQARGSGPASGKTGIPLPPVGNASPPGGPPPAPAKTAVQ